MSVKVYLILMNLVLLCLLFPLAVFVFMQESANFRDNQLHRTINQIHSAQEGRAATLARSLSLSAGEAVAGFDFSLLATMAHQLVDNDPEIVYCIIADQNQKVVVQQGMQRSPALSDTLALQSMKKDPFAEERLMDQPAVVRFLRIDTILEVIVPIYNGNQLWGVLRCGHSLEKLNQEIDFVYREWAEKMHQFKIYLFSIMALFFVIGTCVALLATRCIVQSIKALNTGVKRVAAGELQHEIKMNKMSCDEFFVLAAAFNGMTKKLCDSYNKLQDYSRSLEEKVVERTKDLEEAQASLVQQAHEAGMAEMAVGVLHNIGNAITPAQVGLSLLGKRLEESPLRVSLERALAPINDLLSRDNTLPEKDKMRIAEILELLPKSLRQEYDQAISEINRVKEKQEHVEGIIALQMRYAKLIGNFQEVHLNQLVEDSLHILDDLIEKRQVQVLTEMGQLPLIRTEETKLMQILINLIKNAFEAMTETAVEDRRIFIATSFEAGETGYVVFRIKDNGCGFNVEERDKLFSFGYSTKARGAGFGLHSCANYIIANQGSIEAKSDGPGKGAEFIIRLPIKTVQKVEESYV